MTLVEAIADGRINANAHVGHALAHHLQMDLLRAHLRLSIQDLKDKEKEKRHAKVLRQMTANPGKKLHDK